MPEALHRSPTDLMKVALERLEQEIRLLILIDDNHRNIGAGFKALIETGLKSLLPCLCGAENKIQRRAVQGSGQFCLLGYLRRVDGKTRITQAFDIIFCSVQRRFNNQQFDCVFGGVHTITDAWWSAGPRSVGQR